MINFIRWFILPACPSYHSYFGVIFKIAESLFSYFITLYLPLHCPGMGYCRPAENRNEKLKTLFPDKLDFFLFCKQLAIFGGESKNTEFATPNSKQYVKHVTLCWLIAEMKFHK